MNKMPHILSTLNCGFYIFFCFTFCWFYRKNLLLLFPHDATSTFYKVHGLLFIPGEKLNMYKCHTIQPKNKTSPTQASS